MSLCCCQRYPPILENLQVTLRFFCSKDDRLDGDCALLLLFAFCSEASRKENLKFHNLFTTTALCESILFFVRMVNFQKKSDATSLCLVFDASQVQDFQKGSGYHHPQRSTDPPRGLDLYPAIFLYPSVSVRRYDCDVERINLLFDILRFSPKQHFAVLSPIQVQQVIISGEARQTLAQCCEHHQRKVFRN